MTKIEKIEQDIRKLSGDELAMFRKWFIAFDAAEWDRQIEDDVKAGRLDALASEALADHQAGQSRRL